MRQELRHGPPWRLVPDSGLQRPTLLDESALRECHESRGTRYSERHSAQNDAANLHGSASNSEPNWPRA
jgi:hypothetical protein